MKQPNKNDYFINVDGTEVLPYHKAYRAYKEYAYDLEDYINHLNQAKNNEVLDLVSQQSELLNALSDSIYKEFQTYAYLPDLIEHIKSFNCG